MRYTGRIQMSLGNLAGSVTFQLDLANQYSCKTAERFGDHIKIVQLFANVTQHCVSATFSSHSDSRLAGYRPAPRGAIRWSLCSKTSSVRRTASCIGAGRLSAPMAIFLKLVDMHPKLRGLVAVLMV